MLKTSLLPLWHALAQVKTLHFSAQSHANTGWNGQGHGQVRVEQPNAETLIFHESGQWQATRANASPLQFQNIFRWTLNEKTLTLAHLRHGPLQAVHLFDLTETHPGHWQTHHPHLCGQDTYAATLLLHPNKICVDWCITGPRKNENLAYIYAFSSI